jgi:hypothetical protein
MNGTPPRPPFRGLQPPPAAAAATAADTAAPPQVATDEPLSPQGPLQLTPSPAHHDLASLLQPHAAPVPADEEAEVDDELDEDAVEPPTPLLSAGSPIAGTEPETPLTASLMRPAGSSDESGGSDSE